MSNLLWIALAIAGALIYLVAAMAVSRWPLLGLVFIAPLVLLAYDMPSWPGMFSIGSASVQYPDVVALVVFGSALIKTRQAATTAGRGQSRWHPAVLPGSLVLGVFLLLSLGRGIRSFGLSPAVVEARPWIEIVLTLLWVAVALRRQSRFLNTILTWFIWMSALTCGVALVHIAQHGLGNASSASYSSTGDLITPGRPLVAGQAVMIAVGASVALYRYLLGDSRRYLLLVAAFWVVLLAAQDRSAWLAALVATFVLLFAFRADRGIAILCVATVVGLGGLFVLDAGALGSFGHNLIESATNTGTYNGRVFDWQVLIQRSVDAGPGTVLFGFPFGTGWLRQRPDGLMETFVPHNWYVATYLRVGIIGMTGMISALIAALVLSVRRGRQAGLLTACLACMLVFGWTYNPPSYLAPILGIALFQQPLARVTFEARDRLTRKTAWSAS